MDDHSTNSESDKNLESEIIALSGILEKNQKKLKKLISAFLRKKIKNFISLNLSNDEDKYWRTIKSFCFSQSRNPMKVCDNSWKCKYIHETKNFISNNYCINVESEDEGLVPCFKRTRICFGCTNGKYFIQNLSNDVINVYTYKLLPHLYSLEYENVCEFDIDEMMEIYSKNVDIPEWLLIRFLLQVNRHEYYPNKLKKYFKIV